MASRQTGQEPNYKNVYRHVSERESRRGCGREGRRRGKLQLAGHKSNFEQHLSVLPASVKLPEPATLPPHPLFPLLSFWSPFLFAMQSVCECVCDGMCACLSVCLSLVLAVTLPVATECEYTYVRVYLCVCVLCWQIFDLILHLLC